MLSVVEYPFREADRMQKTVVVGGRGRGAVRKLSLFGDKTNDKL